MYFTISISLLLTLCSIKKAAPLHKDNPIFAVKFVNKNYAQRYGRIKPKQIQMETTLHKHVGVHRNIIEFFATGENVDWTWIAMELAEGGDLFDKIEADAGVTEDIAHVYFTQLVNAVGYMHSKGVGHRDIKPENVLLSADGDLKLADFGMATLFEYNGKRKMAVTLCGSPPYVAPEVLSCSSQGDKKGTGYSSDLADIWSCGVVLFVLLAGNTPWNKPVEGLDEYGHPNEFSEFIATNGRPNDELWQGLPIEVLSLLRGMMKVDTRSRFSLEDVRRHPWFTRSNAFMDEDGKLTNPVSLATNMFESLKISFDDDPLADTKRLIQSDAMETDQPSVKPTAPLSSTQPTTPAEDMLFDWEAPARLNVSSTQPTNGLALSSTQSALVSGYLDEEPSMSQFAATPSVPMSRTQMARQFRDILPAQSLTRFFSTWTLNLLVPLILEALSRLAVPVPTFPRPSAQDSECQIKVRTVDGRACTLSGNISVCVISDGAVEVMFTKASGDPLEWRRFFKKVTVLCRDAVYKPE
jgi:serine/threonine-protein kinase CHEK1